jgi:hypothetical protein
MDDDQNVADQDQDDMAILIVDVDDAAISGIS